MSEIAQLTFNGSSKHGVPTTTTTTTTVNGPRFGAGNTSAHEDPDIAHLKIEQDGLRRERRFGRGETRS